MVTKRCCAEHEFRVLVLDIFGVRGGETGEGPTLGYSAVVVELGMHRGAHVFLA